MNLFKVLGFWIGFVTSILLSIIFAFVVFFFYVKSFYEGWQLDFFPVYSIVFGMVGLGGIGGLWCWVVRTITNRKRNIKFVLGYALGISSIALLIHLIF